MKHAICRAEINQDIYVHRTKAEKKEGKPKELQVFGACSIEGCTRRAVPKDMKPLVLKLCEDHLWDLSAWRRKDTRKQIAEMDREGLITQHTKGWTYVVRLKNGNLKIGTSIGLNNRLQKLSREQGFTPVVVLAVLEGGTSREQLAHNEWESYRLTGAMEEYHPSTELLEWAEQQGIHESAQPGVADYFTWEAQDDGSAKWARWGAMWDEAEKTKEENNDSNDEQYGEW